MIFKVLAILVALLAVAALWVRFAPLPAGRLSAKPGPMEPGVHPLMGAIKVVRPLETLPEGAFNKMLAIAAATPRTERIGLTAEPAAFVTRTKLWGFPDIAVIWVADGALHVHSKLVFGRSDMGVNALKVTDWFDRLEDQ